MGDLLRRRTMVKKTSAPPVPGLLYKWDFTKSITDEIQHLTATGTFETTSEGVYLSTVNSYVMFSDLFASNHSYQFDITANSVPSRGNSHGRFIMITTERGFIYRSTGYWSFWAGNWDAHDTSKTNINAIVGKTVTLYVDANNYWHIYIDGVSFLDWNAPCDGTNLQIGSGQNSLYGITVSGVRIYEGEVLT